MWDAGPCIEKDEENSSPLISKPLGLRGIGGLGLWRPAMGKGWLCGRRVLLMTSGGWKEAIGLAGEFVRPRFASAGYGMAWLGRKTQGFIAGGGPAGVSWAKLGRTKGGPLPWEGDGIRWSGQGAFKN